jgi:hypothetical protein
MANFFTNEPHVGVKSQGLVSIRAHSKSPTLKVSAAGGYSEAPLAFSDMPTDQHLQFLAHSVAWCECCFPCKTVEEYQRLKAELETIREDETAQRKARYS